jgi:hypothetical protein
MRQQMRILEAMFSADSAMQAVAVGWHHFHMSSI